MEIAIKKKDFERCMLLAEKSGISIDLETPEGYTVLIAAAEEDKDMVNYSPIINSDGTPCLIVEYLLDREFYRPAINLETKNGLTALIRACEMSRTHVIESLLDRGADINYRNRFGKTAVHYTAQAGNKACTKMLVERMADLTIKDNDGRTAYQIAEQENYTDLMTLLSQFGGGFLGPLQITRGRTVNYIRCTLGCGVIMSPHELKDHLLVCTSRTICCPNECDDTRLMWKELDEHLVYNCNRRQVSCLQCNIAMEYKELKIHEVSSCDYRIITCPLGCEKEISCIDFNRHALFCNWRKVFCPQNCKMELPFLQLDNHVTNLCDYRLLACPQKCHNFISFHTLQHHLRMECTNQHINCKFCKLKLENQKNCEKHEKLCEYRMQACINKCGIEVHLNLMNQHVSNECKNRFVNCHLQCNLKVRFVDMENHMRDQCTHRLLDCENGCCDTVLKDDNDNRNSKTNANALIIKKIPMYLMESHKKFDCVEREVKCSLCVLPIKLKFLEQHQRQDCERREVNCRILGCLKKMPWSELETHERFHCNFRLVACAQGCGETIAFLKHGVHNRLTCLMRPVECPMRCGMQLRAHELDLHLEEICIRNTASRAKSSGSRGNITVRGIDTKLNGTKSS
jgi:hypothetical protein